MNSHENNTDNAKNMHDIDDNASSHLMVEEQIAHNIIELLDNRAQHLTITEEQRLAKARNLAVNQLANIQSQLNSHHGINQSGNTLQWFGHYLGQHKVMSTALVIGAMLLAIFAVQLVEFNDNIENSDAFLLASDLPPEAYADKGFNTWLSSN